MSAHKGLPTLTTGSRVFASVEGVIREWTINGFQIVSSETGLRADIKISTGERQYTWDLLKFMEAIEQAQNCSISEIYWEDPLDD